MQSKATKLVEQNRAAVLLGIPESELSRVSGESGIGRREKHGGKQVMFFTYEDLRKICLLSARLVQ